MSITKVVFGQVAGWHQRLTLYDADRGETLLRTSLHKAPVFTSITDFGRVGKTKTPTHGASAMSARGQRELRESARDGFNHSLNLPVLDWPGLVV